MSMIDESVIQKALFISTDIISKKLHEKEAAKAFKPFLGCRLLGGDTTTEESTEIKVLNRQSQLFSESITDSGSAAELFCDNVSSTDSIDNSYIIKTKIYFDYYDTDKFETVYFDIDSANNNSGKFFISRIFVKHNPTDSFTLKSNYQINLKINFSTYDDLFTKNVKAKKLSDDTEITIPLISLLYKFYKIKDLNNSKKDMNDGSGIFISQEIILNNKSPRNKKIINFAGKNIFKKIYHLAYHKHSIEMFKDNDPLYKFFENELSIDFVAYEATSVQKDSNSSNVPNTNNNLYSLVFNEQSNTLAKIKELQDKLSELTNAMAKCQINEVEVTEEQSEKFSIRVENYMAEIQNLRYTIDEELMNKILDKVEFYAIPDIPLQVINVYEQSDTEKKFLEILPSTLFGGFGAATAVAFSLPFASLTVLAAAGYAVYAVIAALGATKLVSREMVNDVVRKYVSKSIENIKNGAQLSLALKSEVDKKTTTASTAEERKKATGEAAQSVYGTEVGNKEKKINLWFTTFGQVLNIFKDATISKNLKIISGGFFFNEKSKLTFINFADIPISVKTLTTFLYKYIILTERNLFYDSEVFLRDLFENLIKKILDSSRSYLSKYNINFTTNIKINGTIHNLTAGELNESSINLLDDTSFFNFKKKFIDTKDIKKSYNTLYKVYTIGSYEDIKYHDFYKAYNNGKKTPEKNFNTIEFQNFINKNYQIPCILLNNVSERETILKKKYISFTKQDNPSLVVGNLQAQNAFLRYPYKCKVDFKANMASFIGPGGYIFVAPPYASEDRESNTFGYGGLYAILSTEFEYFFQRLESSRLTLPNFESRISVEMSAISYGDQQQTLSRTGDKPKDKDECKQLLKILDAEPAAGT